MHTRLPLALALLAACNLTGCAATPDDAGAPADDGPAAERADALTFPTMAASMSWADPAHDTLTLIPGSDHKSATDDAPADHEVYQVLVDPRPNTQNGQVTVSKFWKDATESSCVNRSLSVRTAARPATSLAFSDVVQTDVTSTYIETGGEFPQSGCEATVTFNYLPTAALVRVMAQARTRIVGPQIVGFVKAAASVTARGDSPAPKLVATMNIDPDGAANAVVVNQGPVTATSVDADITYSYDYCPPALSGESPYCVHQDLDQGECAGPYCGPGTWGFGQREPVKCSWTKDFPEVTINANGGVLNWVWHQSGTQARCGLCEPGNNRCANPHAYVVAKSTTAPYSAMPAAVAHDFGPDVF